MRVAVKMMVPVWAEVDLKAKEVENVYVMSGEIGKGLEYRVILDDGSYDEERYAGSRMREATKKILDTKDWPRWEFFYG